MNFSEMIGQDILVMIPLIEDHYQIVKLHGVESGGIWIESQEMLNSVYSAVGKEGSERTPIFFFPYHQIGFAMASVPGMALNERAFGV